MLKNIDEKSQKNARNSKIITKQSNIKVEIRRWESYNKIIKNRKTNF